MSAHPIPSAIVIESANSERSYTVRPIAVDTLQVLQSALDSCGRSVRAAQQGLMNGSVAAARFAFENAEKAFEEAQDCVANLASEQLSNDVEEKIRDLGLELDKIWVRLVCAFR